MKKMYDDIYAIFKREFPDFEPRDGQIETVEKIINAFKTKKHVVFEGPTGSGKSIVAYLYSCYADEFLGEKSCMTTITKALQDQYNRDFILADIRSSKNEKYRCSYGYLTSDTECKPNIKETDGDCKKLCPYKVAFSRYMKESKSSTNLSFFVALPFSNRDTLIVDECHKLSDVVLSAVEFKFQQLNDAYLDFALINHKKNIEMFKKRWFEVIDEFKKFEVGEVFNLPFVESLSEALKFLIMGKTFLEEKKTGYEEPFFKKTLSHIKGLIGTLENIRRCEDKLFVVADELVFKPIYASAFADEMLFSKVKKTLHMSATVCGFEAYCEEVGINIEDAEFIEMDHVIPADKRPAHVYNVSWMSYKRYEDDVRKTVAFVDGLMKKTGAEENMIVHTVSYKRADDIKSRSKYDVRVPRTHAEVVEVLNNEKGVIVASPSICAGIDAKDDMARYNVIAKLPFPSFGDPRIKFISQHSPNLLSLMVIRDVVQAAGRTSRHENDWSKTYIIDGNFKRLMDNNRNMFPDWFKESLVYGIE